MLLLEISGRWCEYNSCLLSGVVYEVEIWRSLILGYYLLVLYVISPGKLKKLQLLSVYEF